MMTKADITIGTTVYVHWYGKLLQGTVVSTNDLFGMTAVSIPVQGTPVIALFTPAHVYASPEDAAQPSCQAPLRQASSPPVEISEKSPSPLREVSQSSPSSLPDFSETLQRLQAFKAAHWDAVHNHLLVSALDAFYDLWREAHTQRAPPATDQSAAPVAIIKRPARSHHTPTQLSFNFTD